MSLGLRGLSGSDGSAPSGRFPDWSAEAHPSIAGERVTIHGMERAFVRVGDGPVVLLIHGIGHSSYAWRRVIPLLAERYTVIAPDLLGHGESDKPRADYSLGGYANGMRDLLAVLDVPRATVVGHSFGGGVAIQMAYQYPQMVERLVVANAGGLGRSVAPAIRALTIPGTGPFVAAASQPPVQRVLLPLIARLHQTGLPGTQDLEGLAEVYRTFSKAPSRAAFRRVARAVIDWRGQIVTWLDRAYLAEYMPSMIIWGRRDITLPVRHAYAAKELLPGSRLEIFDEAGHMPHLDEPELFAGAVDDFIATSPESTHDNAVFAAALKDGPVLRRHSPNSRSDLEQVAI